MSLRLYNSLTRKVEEFVPLSTDFVTMYTCGPTVYDFAHIGNFRTFTLSDFVYRTLKFNDYKVNFIMNITDVGHLTGDNLGDADLGEDRMEIAAAREGRSTKEVARFYTEAFLKDFENLNLSKPDKFPKASDYIKEQIELVKKLEENGVTYRLSDGIYFDTAKFKDYGLLAGRTEESTQEGARVEAHPEKKNPADFALWRFSPQDKMRWQEWNSPWGRGFPGWHVECSAMAIKELGETIDIHIGGEDHKMIHHPNEIAQSECATGKKFVKYWMHGAYLQVDDGRMGKSLKNTYTVSDIEDKNFNPLALRYFYMSAHYRGKLNFTWEALQNAQNTLKKLYDLISSYQETENAQIAPEYYGQFKEVLNTDLNLPKAVAVMWDLLKSDVGEAGKIATLLKFDEVLGLDIENFVGFKVPDDVQNLAKVRFEYRQSGIWDKADQLRRQIAEKGFVVEDTGLSYKIKRKV